MMKRSRYTLQRIAAELDEAASEMEHFLRTTGVVPATHHVSGSHIQQPAYVVLVHRMAVLNAQAGDDSRNKRAFQQFDPRVIQDLYFLQQFIMQTIPEPGSVSVTVEMEAGDSGLVKTLIVTSSETHNVFRMQVQSCSLGLRSNPACFELLDGVRLNLAGVSIPS